MASWTQAQLDALEAAIAEGALSVKYGDKEVVYRSLKEMIYLRDLMQSELGVVTAPKRTFASFSKGLYPCD